MRGFWSLFMATVLLLALLLPTTRPARHIRVPTDFYGRLAEAARLCMEGNCVEENGAVCVTLVGLKVPRGGTTLPPPEVGKVCWR